MGRAELHEARPAHPWPRAAPGAAAAETRMRAVRHSPEGLRLDRAATQRRDLERAEGVQPREARSRARARLRALSGSTGYDDNSDHYDAAADVCTHGRTTHMTKPKQYALSKRDIELAGGANIRTE